MFTLISKLNELSKKPVDFRRNKDWTKALLRSVLGTLTGDSNGFLVSCVNEGFLAVVVIRFREQVGLLIYLGRCLNLDLIADKMFISTNENLLTVK